MIISRVNINTLIFLGLVIILSFLPGFLHILNYFPDEKFEHQQLHSFIESVGAVFNLLISFLIYNRFRNDNNELDYPVIAISFLSMGLFDMYHAITSYGNPFVFSHIISVFFGGFWFGVLFLPDSIKKIVRKPFVFRLVILVWLLFIVYMSTWPENLTVMVIGGQFTLPANALNGLAFIGFSLGVIKLLLRYRKTNEFEVFFFALVGLVQALSRLSFSFSNIWHLDWWMWHIYRFAGSGIIFYIVLRTFNTLIKENSQIIRNLQTILDSMPFGVVVIGMDRKILQFNKAAEKLTGFTIHDLWSEFCYDTICPTGCNACPISDSREEVINVRKVVGMKNGGHLPVIKSIIPIELSDKKVLLESFIDISELKNTEAKLKEAMQLQEQSNQELEQLAYAASHDLQEPLRKINNFIDLLKKENKFLIEGQNKKYFNSLQKNSLYMRQLILDLQEITRLNQKSMKFSSVNTNKITEKILNKSFQNISYSLEQLPIVNADEKLLTKLFSELFDNAQKFNANEHPEITISCIENADFWEFCIKDNGIGFEQQYEDKIFIVFEKLHYAEKYSGTGTGLTLCKKIARFHGGYIWAKSLPGEGASFFFTLKKQL